MDTYGLRAANIVEACQKGDCPEIKVFGQAFSKACGVQGQSPCNPP